MLLSLSGRINSIKHVFEVEDVTNGDRHVLGTDQANYTSAGLAKLQIVCLDTMPAFTDQKGFEKKPMFFGEVEEWVIERYRNAQRLARKFDLR